MGAPPAHKTTEGRVNPRGISYLYLATNLKTAVAEIRPWIDAKISVGEFVTVRPLTIIDCTKYHDGIGEATLVGYAWVLCRRRVVCD